MIYLSIHPSIHLSFCRGPGRQGHHAIALGFWFAVGQAGTMQPWPVWKRPSWWCLMLFLGFLMMFDEFVISCYIQFDVCLIFVYSCVCLLNVDDVWLFLLMVVADFWYGCPSNFFAPINYIPQIATNRAEQADRQILWRWPAASNTVGTWYQCVPRVPFLVKPLSSQATSRRFQATAGWPLILLGLPQSVSRYIHIPELQHDGHFGVSDGDRGALKIEKKTSQQQPGSNIPWLMGI